MLCNSENNNYGRNFFEYNNNVMIINYFSIVNLAKKNCLLTFNSELSNIELLSLYFIKMWIYIEKCLEPIKLKITSVEREKKNRFYNFDKDSMFTVKEQSCWIEFLHSKSVNWNVLLIESCW